MAQLLFTLLAMFSGASIGAGLITIWYLYQLRGMTVGRRRRWYLYMMLTKGGAIGTFTVLLVILVPRAAIDPSFRAWSYIASLGVAAWGLVGMAAVTADELASAESRTDESGRKDDEDVREARTAEDKKRANLRGWEDDSRFGEDVRTENGPPADPE